MKRIKPSLDELSPDDRQLAKLGCILGVAFLLFIGISRVWRGSWLLIAAFFIPFAVYLFIVRWLLRGSFPSASTTTRIIIIGLSLVYHSMLLFSPQSLSNDIYRYYWDGKVMSAGINPYRYPPAADELTAYRDEYWLKILNREIPTGYPPLSVALFSFAYRLYPDPWTNRLLAVLASLASSLLLMSALRHIGKDERASLVYAWSPLVVLEFGNSGHLDSFGIVFLCAALVMNLERKPVASAICLALGGLAKFLPIILVPIWGRRWPKSAWLAFALTFCLPWLFFYPRGTPFRGLTIFAMLGDFNGSLYKIIEWCWSSWMNASSASIAARATCTIILLLGYSFIVKKSGPASVFDGWRYTSRWLGLALLLSPVVHPWYLCWMLAFISLEPMLPWLLLSGSIIFARQIYIPYEQAGIWQEAGWAAAAVYLPFYLSIAYLWIRRRWTVSLFPARWTINQDHTS